jgi:hypothetical protein
MKRYQVASDAVQSTASAMYPIWLCNPWPIPIPFPF